LRETYGPGFYGADDDYFDWFYLKNPCLWFAPRLAEGIIPVNAILSERRQIAALHAYLPFDAITPWGGQIGVWDIEWINGSGIRGAGRALVRHLLQGIDIYAGFGCNELSENAFRKIGLEVKPEIPRCVWMVDAEGWARVAESAGIPPGMGGNRTQERHIGDRHYHRIPLGSVPDRVLEESLSSSQMGVTRRRTWLNWRYVQHPFIRYDIISADPDGLGGVAVVRVENIAGTEQTVCRILDLLTEKNGLPRLLTGILAFANREGCLLVDYFTTAESVAGRLVAASSVAGFEALRNPPLPFMFQPLAMSSRNSINFVASVGAQVPQPIDFGGFYATKADANQDILRSTHNAPVLKPAAIP